MVPSLGSFIELRAATAGMSRRWVEVLDEHESGGCRQTPGRARGRRTGLLLRGTQCVVPPHG